MSDTSLPEKRRRPLILVLVALAAVALIALVVWLAVRTRAPAESQPTPIPTEVVALPSPTPEPRCPEETVQAGLARVLEAIEAGSVSQARAELDAVLVAYVALFDEPACAFLAQDLLAVQSLVAAATAWDSAQQSGSARQVEEAVRLAGQAALLTDPVRHPLASELADLLVVAAEQRQASLAAATVLDRVIAEPQTLAMETAGGLYPLCLVNAVVKPLLAERTGSPVTLASQMEVVSETVYLLAGGQLMEADLPRTLGTAPGVFVQPADPGPVAVGGAVVEELVDLTGLANGDLLLLEKSGRLLRRTLAGDWSVERPALAYELPIAVAPYGERAYLLDPANNQIWRHSPGGETEGYPVAYFAEGVVRDLGSAVDLAIDGAIYVVNRDGRVRRYFVGVQDPAFQPDTDLGTPYAVFLPDEPDSTLVYVLDGPGRRLLGLDRDTGAYRLGVLVNVEGLGPLTGGDIAGGRLYLSDGQNLLVTILTPIPTPAIDCPAIPYQPLAPLGRSDLAAMDLSMPVETGLPSDPAAYPGGRWPQVGYGVLDGLAFADLPFSSTIRAVAPGTISRIITDITPLLASDLATITPTGRVPAELNQALWGVQVWVDHGNGLESRYGGLAAVLPTLEQGMEARRLIILGFSGDSPFVLGLWVDGEYLGRGRSVMETAAAYQALFGSE